MKPWLSLRRATPWADEIDFVGPRVRTASWAWVLLLAGLAAVAWVLPQVNQADADMADVQTTIKRLQRAAHQQTVAMKAPQIPKDKGEQAPALTPESARRAAQLAQWLAYPWMPVLAQVEAAAQAEQAVMLSLSLDLSTLGSQADTAPELRVSAAVRDDASALRWVQAQGSSAQLLTRERLSTPFAAASGQYDWRAEASFAGSAP